MAERPRTNFGERPEGWVKITVDLPEPLAERIKALREGRPHGALKLIATAAFGLFLGMEPETREELIEWAHLSELRPTEVKPADAFHILAASIRNLGKTPLIDSENPKPGKGKGKDGGSKEKKG